MSLECPIHKVAKTDRVSDNECKTCELFYTCPLWVFDDLEIDMVKATADAYGKIQGILKEQYDKKLREQNK